jgi:hypothetical protein
MILRLDLKLIPPMELLYVVPGREIAGTGRQGFGLVTLLAIKSQRLTTKLLNYTRRRWIIQPLHPET